MRAKLCVLINVSCTQDLPNLYLQGGSIIPMGPTVQHVGETKPTDELFLMIALDENGNFLFNCLTFRLYFGFSPDIIIRQFL